MSGGVDSSVAAAMLVTAGYEVTGGFMKNFSSESWTGVVGECPWEQDFADVQAVCRLLNIPCRSFNFEKIYAKSVIENFFREYRAGRTPNPDVLCNRDIKFGAFFKEARRLGFTHIATGHYAQRVLVNDRKREQMYELRRGKDRTKDQSYFLYRITQDQLAHTFFPLGKLTKVEVRSRARRWQLPTAGKPDSQGICFIGHVDVRKFLQQRLAARQGDIVDTDGRRLGEHPGVWYYTIGQRHGLGLSGGPWYVAAKDIKRNRLVVAHGRRHARLYSRRFVVSDLNWVNTVPPTSQRLTAQIRYRQLPQACRVQLIRMGAEVTFAKPQFAPALGQSVVFIRGTTVLGGGILSRILE